MHIDFNPDQRAFQAELRQYFADVVTPEVIEEIRKDSEGGGPLYQETLQRMGRDGYLGIGWPTEYGGQGRSPIEQWIFADEIQRTGFPLPFLTLNTVGPTIRRFGGEDLKKEFLPRILRGEVHFAIGYSEPEAGTDLAGLKTRAVRDGDEWVINGSKMWTSLANYADYIWLAARTNPEASKHRGISVFLVPTDAKGFSISPITTIGLARTNATFYEDVRVPAEYLVGEEDNGWSLITGQLNHERVSLMNSGPVRRLVDEVAQWARETSIGGGKRVIDLAWVQNNLARIEVNLEALRLMNWKQAWALTQEHLGPAESSAIKVFGSEFFVEAYRLLLEVMGHQAVLVEDSPGAVLRGRVNASYRSSLILTFGGGTNEVQRDIVAMAGLGLPHYKN